MKPNFAAFAAVFAVIFLSANAGAEVIERESNPKGYTNKSYHDSDGEHYYKHPGQGSFTGPFDYGTTVEVKSTLAPQPSSPGKCNCFTFDGTKSYSGNRQKLTYAWNFGDGSTSDQTVVKHCFDKAGDYTVGLTVTDESGKICGSGTAVTRVSANFPPTANAGPEVKGCLGEAVSFDASRSTSSGVSSYRWDFGDGAFGDGERVSHAYQKPGNYRVHLTLDDGKKTECSVAAHSTTATIVERVDVKLADAAKEGTCVNRSLHFNAEAAGNTKLHWDFGDGETWDGGLSASHAYTKAGTYTVTVTADNGKGYACSVATDRTTVKVFEAPRADAGDNLVCCVGKDNAFDGSKSIGSKLSYHWDFGDGTTGNGVKVSHAYGKGGDYRVVLTVDDGSKSDCGVSSSSFVASVNTKPEAVIQVK